jgi:dethiobiotin synthetase
MAQIFITGTDTGVGKTLLTGLLLSHLRQNNVHALAMKPFCSGDRADVDLLYTLQDGELTRDEINPFYFAKPLAPAVAARKRNRSVPLTHVLERIEALAKRCDLLLIEGIGGACVPLTRDYLVADVIRELGCETIVVATNRLGTIHATLSTCYSLEMFGVSAAKLVLMGTRKPDLSASTNCQVLEDWLRPKSLVSIPYLGANVAQAGLLMRAAKKIKKTLAKLAVSKGPL